MSWEKDGQKRDHPRACGEQFSSQRTTVTAAGSSPRVRGAVIIIVIPAFPVGIIPARAGSRVAGDDVRLTGRDHPRACGEQ